jgi:hypothetical protein
MRIPNRRASVIDPYHLVLTSIQTWGSSSCLTTQSVSPASPLHCCLKFLSSTYEGAAETGGRDRAELECELGVLGRVRRL